MPIGTVDSLDAKASQTAWAGSAERDLLALGTVVAAIILFIGTGGSVLSGVFAQFAGTGMGPDRLLACAFILNIALIIFGWRRYRDLNSEMQVRRIAEEQARILAETDPLTGCLNRRSIGDATERFLIDIAQRGKAAAFVMLDLDNFKQVNDVNGHAAGDALLCAAANRIKQLLPSESLLARFGGDEFACIIPFDPSQHELIDRLCEELIAAVGRPVVFRGAELETTVSAGVTRSDGLEVQHDAQTLLHMADIAMYHAKKRGRNRHYWFEPSMESELRFRSELEAGIRRGITLDEFVPYYEKQIDLKTGELVGFEMLARWQSPTLGIVGPDIFIPIAEEIGVIAQLSENLIRKALKDARSWDPRLTLSVNISPIQLRDPWFAQKLLKLLVEANFPANRLDIEVTENSLHDNVAMVRSMITSLKNQGISVSLDDFGTGYSSLSQLQSLPFDRIKIDRSFITTLPGNRDSATIVRSITSLGQGLGLPITAEGVENEEILRELRQFGDFKAQGYLYGRPNPASVTHAELAQLNLLLEMPDVDGEAAEAADEAATAPNIARIA
jgi:diguanylate cyclase (GGDEF)-like protein